jgi:hypothetical protein
MTDTRHAGAADDLVRLWQESILPSPDPERLAHQVARMTLARFDKSIDDRNLREYIGFVALAILVAVQWAAGGDRVQLVAMTAAGLFVVAYLWWQHRSRVPLDPAADARSYQAALLARIDHQLRLLSRMRYWYLLPLYCPALLVLASTWRRSPIAAGLGFAVITALFVGIGWLNERLTVPFLRHERRRVESLYEDGEP